MKSSEPGGTVYLVDIDNTLADTWPSLQNYVYRSEHQRYLSLSVFIGMRKYVMSKLRNHEHVVFLSARSYFKYYTTKKWLLSCGILADELILVSNAFEKISYVNDLVDGGFNVVYLDDLSYNHEHGNVLFYSDLIYSLNKLPITYMGVEQINLINSVYEGDNQGS
ncbi:hypothetical protein [Pedobacter sp. MC2016-24]|uniref:hypothetical protein n=1 Tax=Pedobacter sp. MC2016-24 TaxID=2780090 RepID=UPI00187EC781|nr:hypothetical protein [Pedobacter sp. MC2016-24]MBE9601660.1 hypothetical protein [Pedobacter sp. MC2016-24]